MSFLFLQIIRRRIQNESALSTSVFIIRIMIKLVHTSKFKLSDETIILYEYDKSLFNVIIRKVGAQK